MNGEIHTNRKAELLLPAAGVAAALLLCALVAAHAQQKPEPPRAAPGEGPAQALIPGGEFLMGRVVPAEAQARYVDNGAHTVQIDAFYMDKTEVTNAQYERFCRATNRKLPFFWGMKEFRCGPEFPDHPVVGVSWADAQAYAEWRGMRLPSEAEWERAARGGLAGKTYANGDDLAPSEANFAPASKGTEKVGSFPANGYGLFDMVGNVGEWVGDFYDKEYYATGPVLNPRGPALGKFRVFRGGGWYAGKMCNTVLGRNALPENWVDFNVGFRCARDAGK